MDDLRAQFYKRVADRVGGVQLAPIWKPDPTNLPQCLAYASTADVIGYGGAAGGGKSELALGIAGTGNHRRSIIFRRVFPSLRGLIERSRAIFNAPNRTHARDSFNESLHVWRLGDGRIIEFGAVQFEQDRQRHQGQPRDFMVFDEATEFTEGIVRYLLAWNRSTEPGIKSQALLTFNPPTNYYGKWVIDFFKPWIGDQPTAKPGELRYFTGFEGKEIEVDGPEPRMIDGAMVTPRSRTFFPAKVTDNSYWEGTGYIAQLQMLPEPLRSQMLYGDMKAGTVDDAWQVIPSKWLNDAMTRWKPRDGDLGPALLGVDIAAGGKDQTVIAPRYGSWWAELEKIPGVRTPTGADVMQLISERIRSGDTAHVDSIGVGLATLEAARNVGLEYRVIGVKFGNGTSERDISGSVGFLNVRALGFWRLRELLDPDRVLEDGEELPEIPPDPELFADLTSPRYDRVGNRIVIEKKEKIMKRIGRSPDCGDAVVLTLAGARRFDLVSYAESLAENDADDHQS